MVGPTSTTLSVVSSSATNIRNVSGPACLTSNVPRSRARREVSVALSSNADLWMITKGRDDDHPVHVRRRSLDAIRLVDNRWWATGQGCANVRGGSCTIAYGPTTPSRSAAAARMTVVHGARILWAKIATAQPPNVSSTSSRSLHHRIGGGNDRRGRHWCEALPHRDALGGRSLVSRGGASTRASIGAMP